MRILVAYASRYGNTQKIAEAIAGAFGPEHQVRLSKVAELAPGDVAGVDLLVIGSPTHAWSFAPEVGEFLEGLKGGDFEGRCAAAFDTRLGGPLTGSAAHGLERRLQKLGFRIAAPRFSTIVKGMKGPLRGDWADKARGFAAAVLEGAERQSTASSGN